MYVTKQILTTYSNVQMISITFTSLKNWGHFTILCEAWLPQARYNINLSLRANFEDESHLVLGRLLT